MYKSAAGLPNLSSSNNIPHSLNWSFVTCFQFIPVADPLAV
jgi:hypothetical protein